MRDDSSPLMAIHPPDEDKLIYACAGERPVGQSIGQIFEYDLTARTTRKISGNDGLQYRHPTIEGVIK